MATAKQIQAARQNVKKAQAAARTQRTISHVPAARRHSFVQEAAGGHRRAGSSGYALEDRNRQQLYEIARERDIPGRSKMDKSDLIEAIRKAS